MRRLPTSPRAREKEKARRAKAKLRKQAQKDKRKAKRAARSVPKLALKAWSRYVRRSGRCAVCGAAEPPPTWTVVKRGKRKGKKVLRKKWILNAHHLLPKERYPQFRTHRKNGVALCPTNHKFGRYSAHRNPLWFAAWLEKHHPDLHRWCIRNMGEHRVRLR